MRYGLSCGLFHDTCLACGALAFLACHACPNMAAIATLKPLERLTFGFLFVESVLAASGATRRGDDHGDHGSGPMAQHCNK